MPRRLVVLLTVAAVAVLPETPLASAQRAERAASAPITTREWRADLKYVVAQLRQWHANPFHSTSAQHFEAAARRLDQAIPRLSPQSIAVEISRLVASVQDAHTFVDLANTGRVPFAAHPIRYEWYSDGIFVEAADTALRVAVGSEVEAVNGVPIKTVITRLSEIGYRENDMTTKLSVPSLLRMPEVLEATGVVPKAGPTTVRLRRNDGFSHTIDVRPATRPVVWETIAANARSSSPLYLRRRDEYFWFEQLVESQTLYVQINRCNDAAKESLAAFAGRLSRWLDSTAVDRIVLDLRWNVGGNSRLMAPIVDLLMMQQARRPSLKIFGIIGRRTLSATIVTLAELRRHTTMVLVGEPTGAAPNLYGENSIPLKLPNSGLVLSVATEYFQPAGPFERGRWIAPDVAAELSSVDARTNHDPALDAALNYVTARNLSTQLREALSDGGVDSAIAVYARYRNDPRNRYVETFDDVRRVAQSLLADSAAASARRFFELNASAYPDRARSYEGLGDGYAATGDRARAVESYRRAIQLLPRDPTLYRALRFAVEKYVRERIAAVSALRAHQGRGSVHIPH